MRDVEPSSFDRLVSARLPHVVAQDLAGRSEDDVRGGVVGRQGPPAGVVDLARDSLPEEAVRVSSDVVEDPRADLLDVVHLVASNRPVVRFLASPFRIEEGLVEDHDGAPDVQHLRPEPPFPSVFIDPETRRRKVGRQLFRLGGFGGVRLVARRDAGVEVIGHVHGQGRELPDHVGVQAMAVVQLDEGSCVEGSARGTKICLHPRHDPPALVQGLPVAGLLDLEQLEDVSLVEEEFGIVLSGLVNQEADRVRQAVRDVQVGPSGPGGPGARGAERSSPPGCSTARRRLPEGT